MTISAKNTLDVIGALIDKLETEEDGACVETCMIIDHILDKLREWSESSQEAKEKHPCCDSASLYITEMKAPLYSIAGIYDYGHSKEQCILWLRSGLRKLAGIHCFALDK